MSKPRVLCCVLTGSERANWLNPDLSMNLIQMARDSRFLVDYFPIRDKRPWEVARNLSIRTARQLDVDWLVSIDNDNFTRCNPLDIIAAKEAKDKDVVGLSYATGYTSGMAKQPNGACAEYCFFPKEQNGAIDGVFREVPNVAGGVLYIRNTVWKAIPQGPWFRWQSGAGELLTDGAEGEDCYFCRLVRHNGFKVWTHTEQLAGHYHTTDISAMLGTLVRLTEQAKGAVR